MVTDAILRAYVDGRMPDTTYDNATWTDVAVAVWNGGGIRTDHGIGKYSAFQVICAFRESHSYIYIVLGNKACIFILWSEKLITKWQRLQVHE